MYGRGSRTQYPNSVLLLFRLPRGIEFLAAVLIILQKSWWTRSTSGESGGDKLLESLLVNVLLWLQLALRKFRRLTACSEQAEQVLVEQSARVDVVT